MDLAVIFSIIVVSLCWNSVGKKCSCQISVFIEPKPEILHSVKVNHKCGFTSAEWREGKFFYLLAILNTKHPRILLFILAAKGILLVHVSFVVHQHPQVLSGKTGCCKHSWSCSSPGTATVPLTELCSIPVCPFLQLAQVPLDGSLTLWCINTSFQFCVICKLADSNSSVQNMNDGIDRDWSPNWSLGTPLVTGLQLGFVPLFITLWDGYLSGFWSSSPSAHPALSSTTSLWWSCGVFSEVEVDNIHCSHPVCQANHFNIDVYQVDQKWLPLFKSLLAVPDDLLVIRCAWEWNTGNWKPSYQY